MQGSKWVLAASLLSAVSFKLLSDAGAMQLLCGNLRNLAGKVDGEANRSWRDGKYWRDNKWDSLEHQTAAQTKQHHPRSQQEKATSEEQGITCSV